MKAKLTIVITLTCASMFSSGCASTDPWTSQDTKYFGAYVLAASADVHSTTRLIHGYDYMTEKNPVVAGIFGDRPSDKELIGGTIAMATINYFIARALPENKRRKYLAMWTFSHAVFATSNYELYDHSNELDQITPLELPIKGVRIIQ